MKRVLIIGATSAIASACARIWAAQGCEFFLVGRDPEKLQQTALDLRARGAGAVAVHAMEATDVSAHGEMLDACLGALHRIDIGLIAYGTLPLQSACQQDVAIALHEFAINGTSVIALLTVLANQFEAQCGGTLAVISSVAGDRGRPSNYLYGSAKAAVSAFCEGLRARLFKAGAHVINIKPGFVDTPMTQNLALPRALVAQPDQVAKRIVRGIDRRVATLYVPAFWAVIMLAIRNIPESLFKRLTL